ncbi:hypothetical protein MVEG_00652 [Podila verticillata NRRL 6337]|nr:hypothetical protein MVEG_00652 [Podila verticillata NRRL 6337]
MPVSERKKFIALLKTKLELESEAPVQGVPRLVDIQVKIDALMPKVLALFKCETQEELLQRYPTTTDMLTAVQNQRYFIPRKTPSQRSGEVYDQLRLHGTDTEYLHFVRVTKVVFTSVVSSVLTQNKIFHNQSNNSQESIEKQFAITLWRMGHHGITSGIGEASKIFGVSEGSILKCTQRCMAALRDITKDIITWPSPNGKHIIKSRVKGIAGQQGPSSSAATDHKHGLSDAIGIMSCMNVFLCSRPSIQNADSYVISTATPSIPRSAIIKALTPAEAASSSTISTTVPTLPIDVEGDELTEEDPGPSKRRKITTRASSRGKRRTSRKRKAPTPPPEPEPKPEPKPELEVDMEHEFNLGTTITKPSAYIKKNYGYRILMVCDTTTRIRFADVTSPGTTQDQDVYESSSLAKEQAKYFEGSDYLIADHAFVPSSTVMVPFLESELRRFRGNTGWDHYSSGNVYPGAEDELDPERVRFNETLAMVQKRGEDCQRALKARFPSLLGLRVQVKDEEGENQVFASNWILACMMLHNLVLGDEASYHRNWDAELDVIEREVLQQQVQWQQQVLFPKPPGRRGRKSAKDKQALEEVHQQIPTMPPPPEQFYPIAPNPPAGLAVLSEIAEGIERRDALCASL